MVPTREIEAMVPAPAMTAPVGGDLVSVIERLAGNPDFDVAKLEKLIEMQERIMRHNSKAAFDAAFAEMQADIPTIIEYGKTDKGTFAELSDIVEKIRPVLRAHGFALSHRTEWPDKSTVKVVGILTHREGHSRESEFMASADTSGSKNAIQALGSAVSYGRRYTTKDLLNITSKAEDDDAERGDVTKPKAPAPAGFDEWLTDLIACADEGMPKLSAAWNTATKEQRKHLTASGQWEALKKRATKVKASA